MKNLLLIGSLSIVLTSCGAIVRTTHGVSEKRLIQTVSVEQGCPVEKIEITNSVKSNGNATYSLNVCGKRMVYKQIGSVFMESSKADEMTNNLYKK